MSRLALLIGAQTDGLTGVDNDLASMAEALEPYGFAIRRCEAENASRAGILAAWEQLIADLRTDDAVVVYYSGHGGFYRPPDYATAVRPRVDLQFIAPVDFHESVAGDFRGITSVELSLLVGRLTAKTRNVVVALDCCHAAHMARGDRRVKALDRPVPYDVVAAHLESLRKRGVPIEHFRLEGNPDAVRIVACAPDDFAYEYTNEQGVPTGALTESLALALTEARGLAVSWVTIVERIRGRLSALLLNQRPEAEGPSHRLLFDIAEADRVGTLPVVSISDDRVRLDGGRLLGAQVGDEFLIMGADSPGPDRDTSIGSVVVDALDATAAFGRPRLSSGITSVPLGALAHRVRSVASAFPVLVFGDGGRGADLVAAVKATPLLRLAEPGERRGAEVRIDDAGMLSLSDEAGPLYTSRSADAVGIAQTVRDLKRLANAQALRSLAEEPDYALTSPITVEFGRVDSGREQPLPTAGAVAYVNQRVYVRVRNDGPDPVYASLFDIGVAARIGMLNSLDPSGTRIDPGKEFVMGATGYPATLAGLPLTWPEGLDSGIGRPESIVVVVTSAPQDLRVFEQGGIRTKGDRSPLQRLFDQLADGTIRDLARIDEPAVRYAVRIVDFDVMPVPPPTAEVARFEVDDHPNESVRLLQPRSTFPQRLAIVLSDLVVHHNRAFRSADIRLDTLVITGGDTVGSPYRAKTERFHNVRDGDRLPLDRMLIYHGPVVDYLDLAVWVSRDSAESLELNDLLKQRLTDVHTTQALTELGLVIAAPYAAATVAAVGLSAIIINTGYSVLRGVVGDSIGLYRTTLLAHERFGIGRGAENTPVRAQDFSFTYEVEAVS